MEPNVPNVGGRLSRMVIQADFVSLLLFLNCDYLKKMLGEKVEMEVVVEIVVEVAAKVL